MKTTILPVGESSTSRDGRPANPREREHSNG